MKENDKSRESKENKARKLIAEVAACIESRLCSNCTIFHPLKHKLASAGLKQVQKLWSTKSSGYTFIKVQQRKSKDTNTLFFSDTFVVFGGEEQMNESTVGDQPSEYDCSLWYASVEK